MANVESLLVGLESGLVALTLTEGQWQVQNQWLAGKPVIGVGATEPGSPQLYLAVRGYGIFKLNTKTAHRRQVLSVNARSFLHSRNEAGKPGSMWVGTEPPGLWYSDSQGQTWHDLSQALQVLPEAIDWAHPEPPYQAWVGTLAGNETQLLAAIQMGNLLQSQDQGLSWQLADIGLEDVVLSLSQNPQSLEQWVAGTDDGIYFSEDNAQNWTWIGDGLGHDFVTEVAILPDGSCLAIAGGTPPGVWIENATNLLYRAEEPGQIWTATDVAEAAYHSALLISGGQVFLGTQAGQIFVSTDGGHTWVHIWQGDAAITTLHPG